MKSYSFDEDVAKQYGVEEAVVIRSFQFWIDLNKANGRNLREGRTWTFNTYASLAEQFPFFNDDKIRRLLESLVKQNVLLKTNKFNRLKYDKTNWYAFEDESKWINVQKAAEIPLAILPDAEDLFYQKNNDNPKIAVNEENEQNPPLAILPVAQVSEFEKSHNGKMNRKAIGNSASSTDEIASPSGKNATIDLAKTSDQYQILTKLLTTDVVVVINDGGADALAFNFNDTEEIEKQIRRQFRMFVKDAEPHWTNVDKIKYELLTDVRIELSRKVCWVIILKAFMQYQSLNKEKQNISYLLGMIQGMKNDFVAALEKEKKRKDMIEASKNREQSAILAKKEADEFIDEELERIKNLIEEHKDNLAHSEIRIVNDLLDKRRYIQAGTNLRRILSNKNIQIENAI